MGAIVLLGLVEVAVITGVLPERDVPRPSQIVLSSMQMFGDADRLRDVYVTTYEWVVGLAIAALIGVSLGVVLGSSERAYLLSRFVIDFFRPIPSAAFIPLFILVLGSTFEARFWLIVYAATWPILFNTVYGMHDVHPLQKETARAFGHGRISTLYHVTFRSSFRHIFAGIRIASSIALIIAVSVELFISAGGGLGTYIATANFSGKNVEAVYAATFVIGLLGLLADLIFRYCERALLPERRATAGGSNA